ncbi:hypothetical protein H7A72_08160 [Janibacter sp. YB324]|nr:hypothetical protein [Janibacter sp. YB324]QNF92822.1 hypothetical protein H7A72_08160 [Janibacter sp. YB324]
MFVIARLGHLLGAALVDAELHERDRRRALELDAANTETARSVAALNHREAVHEEFTRLAATRTELDVATSLSRFTDSTVVLHDRFAHETTRTTAAGELPPVGERASLEAVIGGRPELGTIELEMRAGQGRDDATFALQYASVALGLLRAHAAAMNEMENRLSRDLLDDLLEGIPADVAADRASAQGHDLGVPHDLIVCAWSFDTGPRCHDRDVDHLRTAMPHQRLPCLVVRNQGLVVVLAHQGVDIGRLFDDLSRAYGDTNGVIAMGEPTSSPEEIPRAYEQAQRALRARQQSRDPYGFIASADLGVDRLLALGGNADEGERVISDWLGDLLCYDDSKAPISRPRWRRISIMEASTTTQQLRSRSTATHCGTGSAASPRSRHPARPARDRTARPTRTTPHGFRARLRCSMPRSLTSSCTRTASRDVPNADDLGRGEGRRYLEVPLGSDQLSRNG